MDQRSKKGDKRKAEEEEKVIQTMKDLMCHCCFEARSGQGGPMRRNVSSFKELRSVVPADSLSMEVEHFSLTTLRLSALNMTFSSLW